GLQHGGGDVLAAGRDDDLLLPTGDLEEGFVVQLADVAGVEPAVGQRLPGGLGVVPVALEHDGALDQDLAVVGDPDRRAGDRAADRADLERRANVHAGGSARLGEAVAL